MIRNIVFDMGMVLMAWSPITPCLRYAKDDEKAEKLCDAIFRHEEWGPIVDGGLMTETEYFAHARERLDTQELKEISMQMEKDWWLDSLYPVWGMEKVIRGLHDQGYRLYILSNCGRHFRCFEYRIPGIRYFSGALVSAEEGLIKPDPAIYQRLCDKFGLKAEECIFIDDLQRNIDAARAFGMDGYCFADGDVKRLKEHLDQLNA